MSETIKLRCLRPLWANGRTYRAGETFTVPPDAAQDAVNSGRAVFADDIQKAEFTIAAAKQRELLAARLAREARR